MLNALKNELSDRDAVFGNLFILFGILIQIITFLLSNDTWLSLCSGIFGTVSVVLCSRRKISFYWFGFLQLFTYVIICFRNRFYGEIAENAFYLVTMIVGMFVWNGKYASGKVESRSLTLKGWLLTTVSLIVGTIALHVFLKTTDDSSPLLDSVSTVPAFIAQILMILRYREQWFYWLAVDMTTCVLWIDAGNWCMTAQYVFWIMNCVYGLKEWK